MTSPDTEQKNLQTNLKSDPRYVTIPFEYYRTLVSHFYSVMPSSIPDEVMAAEEIEPDPTPTSVGGNLNLAGVNLFDEMPEGYRKLTNNAD